MRDGRAELIPDGSQVLMPSAVYIPETGPLLAGEAALRAGDRRPDRLILSAKRAMGTPHLLGPADRPIPPVEASAAILLALVDRAYNVLGERPIRVVITVPAWFNERQRQETRHAGALAGLDVVRLLNEPTAAALAYAQTTNDDRTVMVYDFGGGTFDVSIIRQHGRLVEVLASEGDVHLGGDDVDQALEALLLTRLARSPSPTEPVALTPQDRSAIRDAKITLCSEAKTTVTVSHGDFSLRREDLEDVVQPLIERTLQAVYAVLHHANLQREDLDELILVGGSSGLPLVWETLHLHTGLEAHAGIPPREAVGLGAAVQAAMIDGQHTLGVLIDVAPFSLSVGVAAGGIPGFPTHFMCQVVVPRNCALPSRHTYVTQTADPIQPRIRLPVYQGASSDPRENLFLTEVTLDDLPPAPEGQLSRPISIVMEHNLDGMVSLEIRDELTLQRATAALDADGQEHTEGRRRWERHATNHDLEFGDPRIVAQRVSEREVATEHADRWFKHVLEQADELGQQARTGPDTLLALAREGRLHVLAGRAAEAVETLNRLRDEMFVEGVYL